MHWLTDSGADIDFETMVERTNAIVVANPVPQGKIIKDFKDDWRIIAGDVAPFKLVIRRFTVSRIWCIGSLSLITSLTHMLLFTSLYLFQVELYIAMKRDKPIIFRSLVLTMKLNGTVEISSEGVRNLMHNLSVIVNTKDAVSSNPADTFEKLIGVGMENELNRAARAALSAAAEAAGEDVSVLDAFVLGENKLLDEVHDNQVASLLVNAVAFGYTLAVSELLKREPSAQVKVLAKAVYTAAECGRKEALKLLLDAGAETNYRGKVHHRLRMRMRSLHKHISLDSHIRAR